MLWATGALLALLPFFLGMVRAWRMTVQSSPLESEEWQGLLAATASALATRRVRLRRSQEEVVPMVWGWVRPTILLPASAETWTPERKRVVLLHELAHVKRADGLLQWLAHLACALYWCDPLVWLAAHRLRRERERACDDLVLAAGLKPSDYASHLVELARTLRPPGLTLVAMVPMARRAGLTPRVRDLLEADRSRARVTRRGATVSALALLALLAPLARVPTFAADTPAAPRPALHNQWQPRTAALDPRLDQPVQIEILGRAAVPALKLLSEKTGVSLGVMPEDVETLGERKLTIIAQGCTLRTLLVQIPKALQECHWDIDETGKEPAYLLHRDDATDNRIVRLLYQDPETVHQAEHQAAREARVEEARRALAMSPEELAELEKTDLYLARSVKDPKTRFMLELFLALPEEQMNQFVETGKVSMSYSSAPERFRVSVNKLLQDSRSELATLPEFSHKIMKQILDSVQGDSGPCDRRVCGCGCLEWIRGKRYAHLGGGREHLGVRASLVAAVSGPAVSGTEPQAIHGKRRT